MEVHKHPHHITHKKKWNEYLLEFFMLFLAVFLGFIAENVRENIADNHKEKEYMQSIASDLKADTSAIAEAIDEWSLANKGILTIEQALKDHPVDVKGFYGSLAKDFWHFNLFKYDNKTVEELKSSGNFRLVRNKTTQDLIMSYDLDMKYILTQEQDVKDLLNVSKLAETKIADYSQINFKRFNNDSSYSLLNNDPQLIGEYYNKLIAFGGLASYHEYLFRQI